MKWADIQQIEGAPSYRQIDNWTTSGRLKHNEPVSVGQGVPRRWPRSEVEVACRVARLVRAGFTDLDSAFRLARGDVELAPGIRVTIDA